LHAHVHAHRHAHRHTHTHACTRNTCPHTLATNIAQDDDPYVRKTAAVCVAKLYDINPEMVDDRGFLEMLRVRGTGVGLYWLNLVGSG